MSKAVLACRVDLPFYLRLPSSCFLTWDPQFETAAIIPQQRMGEVTFSRRSSFENVERLLDSPGPEVAGPTEYRHLVTCETVEYGEVPTLRVAVSTEGGFAELRAYSKAIVFLVVAAYESGILDVDKARATRVLNHFLDIYKLFTQDPYVREIDDELDLYFVDYCLGPVPEEYHSQPADVVLQHLEEISFPKEVALGRREIKVRLNTLEDLFPGKVMPDYDRNLFINLVRAQYSIPLHYELVFDSQSALKQRRYHIAIVDAETAFEVYVAIRLLALLMARGRPEASILGEMDDPRQLGLISQRLRALDTAVAQHRARQGLPDEPEFVNSTAHASWKHQLYEPRNKIVHEGWRLATFEQAKAAISICKATIGLLEARLPNFADAIQIYAGVEHLQNTAGRLAF